MVSKWQENRFPIAVLAIVVLAYALGIGLTRPTLVGGFEFGMFIIWIVTLLLPIALVVREFRFAGGEE